MSNFSSHWVLRWTVNRGFYALAGDTDGVDGQEEIAGGYLAPDSLQRAWAQGLRPRKASITTMATAFSARSVTRS